MQTSASFGLSIGQNGCGIYPAMLAIMVAPVAHVDIDIPFILTLIVVVISSFGVALVAVQLSLQFLYYQL